MRIKEDLMLRNILGEWIVVPMGERLLEFNGMIKVNESGAFIWKFLEKGAEREEIIAAMLEEYEIDEAAAAAELDEFIETLSKAGVLEA
jgi:hypothetical protein